MKSVQDILAKFKLMLITKVIFIPLVVLISGNLNGQVHSTTYNETLISEIGTTKDDSLKIEKLSELAFYYTDYLGNKVIADSISRKAIDIAEDNYRPGLKLLAYSRYIECNDPTIDLKRTLKYAQEAVKLSKQSNKPENEWRAYRNLVKVYLAAYDYNQALGSSYQALAVADAIENIALKVESYLLIGQSLEGNNQKIEAFRNYLNATSLAEKTRNKQLLKKCYSQLSGFYNYNKIYDKAIDYKLRQVDLIIKSRTIDSVEYMWAQYDLQAISLNSNNNELNTSSALNVLNFAIRNHHLRLKNFEIALYRSHLIEADMISQLFAFYTVQYPDEFTLLLKQNPALYYRLKAYFNELRNKPDSALYYLSKAELLIHPDPNKILQSNFYQRFGQFLVRQGKAKEAVVKFTQAYNLAQQASYFDYMLSTSKSLESLYAQLGDYKNAYTYSAFNRSLTDSINLLTKNDQLLVMEIDHESKQRELATQQEELQTHRRHNLQYTAITIIILSMFVILMMLGSLKVPAWIIKMLGFFSFILFFEFIIMIADHKIYEITANEPWKILLIKIGLIAFLLPFHHWIEKKVTHYLIEHKLIRIPRISLRDVVHKMKKNTRTKVVTDEYPMI